MGNDQSRPNEEHIDHLVYTHVIHQRVIERAFRLVDRASFVPADRVALPLRFDTAAFLEGPLHVSSLDIYAEVVDFLRIRRGMSVLNVGSGSGYFSTVLGVLVGDLGINHGIEVYPNLVAYANTHIDKWLKKKVSSSVGFSRPVLRLADILDPDFWRAHSREYDRIYVSFVVTDRNALSRIIRMLRIGGILVTPGNDQLCRYTRVSESEAVCEFMRRANFRHMITLNLEDRPPVPTFERVPTLSHLARQVLRRDLRRRAYPRRLLQQSNRTSIRTPIGGSVDDPPPRRHVSHFTTNRMNVPRRIVRHDPAAPPSLGQLSLDGVIDQYLLPDRRPTDAIARRRRVQDNLQEARERRRAIERRRAAAAAIPAHVVPPPDRIGTSRRWPSRDDYVPNGEVSDDDEDIFEDAREHFEESLPELRLTFEQLTERAREQSERIRAMRVEEERARAAEAPDVNRHMNIFMTAVRDAENQARVYQASRAAEQTAQAAQVSSSTPNNGVNSGGVPDEEEEEDGPFDDEDEDLEPADCSTLDLFEEQQRPPPRPNPFSRAYCDKRADEILASIEALAPSSSGPSTSGPVPSAKKVPEPELFDENLDDEEFDDDEEELEEPYCSVLGMFQEEENKPSTSAKKREKAKKLKKSSGPSTAPGCSTSPGPSTAPGPSRASARSKGPSKARNAPGPSSAPGPSTAPSKAEKAPGRSLEFFTVSSSSSDDSTSHLRRPADPDEALTTSTYSATTASYSDNVEDALSNEARSSWRIAPYNSLLFGKPDEEVADVVQVESEESADETTREHAQRLLDTAVPGLAQTLPVPPPLTQEERAQGMRIHRLHHQHLEWAANLRMGREPILVAHRHPAQPRQVREPVFNVVGQGPATSEPGPAPGPPAEDELPPFDNFPGPSITENPATNVHVDLVYEENPRNNLVHEVAREDVSDDTLRMYNDMYNGVRDEYNMALAVRMDRQLRLQNRDAERRAARELRMMQHRRQRPLRGGRLREPVMSTDEAIAQQRRLLELVDAPDTNRDELSRERRRFLEWRRSVPQASLRLWRIRERLNGDDARVNTQCDRRFPDPRSSDSRITTWNNTFRTRSQRTLARRQELEDILGEGGIEMMRDADRRHFLESDDTFNGPEEPPKPIDDEVHIWITFEDNMEHSDVDGDLTGDSGGSETEYEEVEEDPNVPGPSNRVPTLRRVAGTGTKKKRKQEKKEKLKTFDEMDLEEISPANGTPKKEADEFIAKQKRRLTELRLRQKASQKEAERRALQDRNLAIRQSNEDYYSRIEALNIPPCVKEYLKNLDEKVILPDNNKPKEPEK